MFNSFVTQVRNIDLIWLCVRLLRIQQRLREVLSPTIPQGALSAGLEDLGIQLEQVPCHQQTLQGYSWEEKMFGFHKPKMYRSIEGCCICRAKSSSSRFTDSKRYEKDFQNCFGLHEARSGDICNACVLLVKRWKKLPAGSKKNWNHVVDARAGPSLKTTLKPKKMKTLSGSRIKSNQISKLQKEFKRHNSDAHSTTSSASPAQSPCYSNQSDDGSDTEMSAGASRTPVFSFLDLTYWKRQKVCCGIIYKGRFGEVLIDTHLFKPCCSNKKSATEKPEQEGPQSPAISTQEEW
ncbi:SIN3-HDAC complex-associated factor isoform X1 [Corvus kubaryi]|uniref:SIN3-HDAC complex associated factor n=1 Tax=Corvus moneduloides TaxID=1196302 RepID=A0A8U7MAX7_CORMO|nr:SIN3-HDAC complex-associated factor isoform X1 [Corvus moneduloides]XP_041906929.1 SIN3-HDAC complex-associated factor isoform X1 [Corvus kubaryi]